MKYSLHLLPLCLFFLPAPPAGAQNDTAMPTGEYYLRGVHEMASGFRINADSSFDFFFIYGAVDRFGKGTWAKNGDTLILNSPPKPAPDFVLKSSKATDDQGIVIQVSDPNTAILRYVLCQIETVAGDTLRGQSDSDGRIVFETKAPLRSIGLFHELFANQPCITAISNPGDNYFEFTFSPSIVDVSIEQLKLKIEADGLRGGHPLMEPGKEYFYERAK